METVFQCMPFINTCLPMRKSVSKKTKIFFYKSMSQLFKKDDNIQETQNKRKAKNLKAEEKLYLNKCPCKVCDVRRTIELFF